MGQYFSPTIEINEDVKYKIEINGPAKFMEWSYLFDATMMALVIMSQKSRPLERLNSPSVATIASCMTAITGSQTIR